MHIPYIPRIQCILYRVHLLVNPYDIQYYYQWLCSKISTTSNWLSQLFILGFVVTVVYPWFWRSMFPVYTCSCLQTFTLLLWQCFFHAYSIFFLFLIFSKILDKNMTSECSHRASTRCDKHRTSGSMQHRFQSKIQSTATSRAPEKRCVLA